MTTNIEERNTNLLKLRPTIKKAASSVAFVWNSIVDPEEAEQMITLHLLERPGSLKKIVNMQRDAQYRAVVGIGHQIASQERADYDYFRGAYRYSVKEIKDALQAGVLVEEFDNFHEVVFDLKESLKILSERSPQYVAAIEDRYVDWNIPKSQSTEQVRLSNAISALTDEMNKTNKRRFANRIDGPGTRKPVSREQARYQSKSGWDDESSAAVQRLLNQGQVSGLVLR